MKDEWLLIDDKGLTQKHITGMKHLLFTAIFVFCLQPCFGAQKVSVEHVHPTCWWAGMHNPELQIMLHGTDIGDLDVELKGETRLTVKEIIRTTNKNYIFLYLDTKDADAQSFKILLKDGKKAVATLTYELLQREDRRLGNFGSEDVLYLLMPDRFATGTTDKQKEKMYRDMKENSWGPADFARHGGDLAGIVQHLDYLQDLGVTAIWPTPTLENNGRRGTYHGYAITNYYRTDPRFGTNEEYRQFVSEAHSRGMKVVKDIVFNHCGSEGFLFADRPADDWFCYDSQFNGTTYNTGAVSDPHVSTTDKKITVDGWFTRSMPDFNGRNKLVADYLIQASIWWVEYAGVDGFRQDTYPYNDFDFIRRWCVDLDAQYPGFNIVGETWVNNPVSVSFWQKDSPLAAPRNSELKTVMDFPMMYAIGAATDERGNMGRIYELLSQDAVYANPEGLLIFLANHDTDRFQSTEEQAQDFTRYQQALTILLTMRGTPQLYYGDEIGMYANKSQGDGALRQNFPGGWPDDSNNAFSTEGRTELQQQYFDFTRKLLQWRKGNKTVAHGNLTHFAVNRGVYVYARQYEGKTVTVIVNGSNREQTVSLPSYAEVLPATSAKDIITDSIVQLNDKLTLTPRQILLLEF